MWTSRYCPHWPVGWKSIDGRFACRSNNFNCTCKKMICPAWFCPVLPVLRLQSHASASARSCLMGPSQSGLSCRNIHCEERKELFRNFCGRTVRSPGEVGIRVPFSEPCTRPSPPAWRTSLRTGWSAPSPQFWNTGTGVNNILVSVNKLWIKSWSVSVVGKTR